MDTSAIQWLKAQLPLPLNDWESEALCPQVTWVTWDKGSRPVRAGERADAFYALARGLVRGLYEDVEGREGTKCFAWERDFFASECFRTGRAATYTVECLEPCLCVRLPYNTVRAVMERRDCWRTFVEQLYRDEVGRLEERNRQLLLLDAGERYRQFCHTYPEWEDRVPLKYIASYLGIHPGSLSRLRTEGTAENFT